jgi:hypothetical protein
MNPEELEELTPSQKQVASEFNTLRGRILGLIESWGLAETQERACKQTFKSLTYDAEARVKELV